MTLMDMQVFLPYVLSQRDGTLGGTCRKARTMLGLGDKQTTKIEARSFPLPHWQQFNKDSSIFSSPGVNKHTVHDC